MKMIAKLFPMMFLAAVLFTGCITKSNSLGPDDPEVDDDPIEIKTPTHMKLTKIVLTRFPANKSNGDKWDYHVFSSSPTRRPDIYVELSKSGSSSHVYRSGIKEDAIFETAYDNFSFTSPASSNGGSLPYDIPVNDAYTIKVWDDDGISSDDSMGSVNINAAAYYNDDNATHVYKTVTSGGITIKIEGRWVY